MLRKLAVYTDSMKGIRIGGFFIVKSNMYQRKEIAGGLELIFDGGISPIHWVYKKDGVIAGNWFPMDCLNFEEHAKEQLRSFLRRGNNAL